MHARFLTILHMCMYMYVHAHKHEHARICSCILLYLPAIIYMNYCKNVLTETCYHTILVESAYTDVMMVGIGYKVLLELTVVGSEGDC